MRALVTGASGFLGSHVVATLLDRGHEVRAILRPAASAPPAAWQGRAEIMRADLRSAVAPADMLDGVDVVVHLAATVRGTPEAQFAGTVVATERLLDAVRCTGRGMRLVLASSYSVYDWTAARGELSEDTPLEAFPFERDGYAIAKLWQERVVRRAAAAAGWTLTVLRAGFIYGKGGQVAAGAGMQVGRALLVVAPFAHLPLTHVRNCAAAFASAAEKGIAGTFNIVDDERVSAWRYAGALVSRGKVSFRAPVPYGLGLGVAHLAQGLSRLLFPATGGKLPGVLIPRRYRARFRPLRFANGRARRALDWSPAARFEGAEIT
jgi:UDP-glucose 4-epimerase